MAENEGYYWIKRQAGDWIIMELSYHTYGRITAWRHVGSEEEYDEPDGEIGPKIEPPEWVVIFPSGTTHGPFTEAQAHDYLNKQYPGSGATAAKQ
jgi:hypothetical protein